MSGFALDPRIDADSVPVLDLTLCSVRLQADSRFAWLVLVPRRAGAVELTDLSADDRALLTAEIASAADALKACAPCDKINIGALGNIVSQLHVHVVARRRGDPCWPGPVWGCGAAVPYADGARQALVAKLRGALAG